MRHQKITIKCLICETEKKVFYADVQRGSGKFCSRKCYNENKRKIPKFFNCIQCGKEKENVFSQRTKKFCSVECKAHWQKGKPLAVNLQGKAGRRPRTHHLRKRPKHGGIVYEEWRTKIFERDNYTCQECGQRGGKLNADHIKPYQAFPELRFEMSNGRTLCVECHKKTDSYGWKNYWNNYVKAIK